MNKVKYIIVLSLFLTSCSADVKTEKDISPEKIDSLSVCLDTRINEGFSYYARDIQRLNVSKNDEDFYMIFKDTDGRIRSLTNKDDKYVLCWDSKDIK